MRLITYSVLVFLLLSCRKENATDCFKSNGAENSQIRYPGRFTEVVVFDKFDVHISQGSEMSVELVGGQNLFGNIVTRMDGEQLIIENLNKCNFVRGYKKQMRINITLPYLRKASNNSVGPLYIRDFTQDTLLVRAESSGDIRVSGDFKEIRTSSHGNGDIYLSGSSNTLFVYAYGTNFLNAEQLTVRNYAFVETFSIGDCSINAEQLKLFEYNIWREGNIYYKGRPPQVNDFSTGEGSGKAIPLD